MFAKKVWFAKIFCSSKQDGITFPVIYVHFWSHGAIMELYHILEHCIAADLYETPEMLICMSIKGNFHNIIINFQVTCFCQYHIKVLRILKYNLHLQLNYYSRKM